MARATRSTTHLEKDKPAETAPSTRKTGSKKRKRVSNVDAADQPAAKQPRTDIKEEDSQELEELPAETKEVDLPSSGDVPIQYSDAQKILDVLEMVDTQGLLDRVFPLPTDSLSSTSSEYAPSSSTESYSFRALLKNSSQYPLRVLRSAIQHLYPISSHPRSRPSAPAAQQRRFCDLALSLLDQASFQSSPIPLNVESIIPDSGVLAVEDANSSSSVLASPTCVRKRKYALMQRLPTGNWWTSLDSHIPSAAVDGKDLKDLPTAYAELVAILPSASTSASEQRITLANYVPKRAAEKASHRPPGPRQLSCGRFLDYGPYASFAPSFDQDGAEIGRCALGEVVWRIQKKRRARERIKGKQKALAASVHICDDDVIMADASNGQGEKQEVKSRNADLVSELESLLPPEEVKAIKSALGSLELETAVQELLDRNSRALKRLEELQLARLGQEGGGSSTVEVGSEEWDVAQGIFDSLTLLASLRPRSSADSSSNAPIVPPSSVLRKLHRTLPLGVTQGWYGTLPEGRTSALRDDTTIHVRLRRPPFPIHPTPYPANYQASQYRGGYGTYTPGQASGYYANYAAQAQASGAHYPSQQYTATGQHQYAYSSWYNYQPPAVAQAQAAAGGVSGRATPQPAATSTMPANYASFFAATQQPQPQRAVANTVVSAAASKAYPQGTWSGATAAGYAAPTLPPHLRSVVGGTSAPGTPAPSTPSGSSTYGYFGAQAAPAAR
ncbi:hypothetical protein A0H81_00373 [Grifola frondosa]|uniref:Uncharacterized protein n=1 Tax=Grifola frondosa TaxID=5627 RepID=A0A1C7MX35_GRIFR|nr:hypothetical protein A0H81_00373 [Grifola frondosa]